MTIHVGLPLLSSRKGTVRARRVGAITALKGGLVIGLASGGLIAGIGAALAAGETLTWSGAGNGTAFASESNWTDITVRGWVPVLDEDGNTVYSQVPVLYDDGSPVYSWEQVVDEDGNPLLDEDGNEQWIQGDQVFEEIPVLEEGDVLLVGPPDGEQNMLLLSGTPNISSSGRHVHDVDLLGGEFLIRTGTVAAIPGDFFVDGTLTIGDTGILTIRGDDSRGQNLVTAREAVIKGGTARGTGILRVTGENSQTHAIETGLGMTQSGGLVTELTVETPFYDMSGGTLSALVNFDTHFSLSGTGEVTSSAVLNGVIGSSMTQSGGIMNGTVAGIDTYTQTGGAMGGKVTTADYSGSAGAISGEVIFSNSFLLTGTGALTETASLTQTGGTMASGLGPFGVYTQSGGLMSGTITVGDYNLTDASALSADGTIDASEAFNLGPETGNASVGAKLTGTGGIVKTGASTVVLTNADNDFSGTVAITAGTLEVVNDALTEGATIAIEPDATLKLSVDSDTLYMGDMTGSNGDLVKAGGAAATLGGNVTLGDLWIDAGRLNIGTGLTTNEATFESATVAAGSTLYIANNATLTIRVPQHLVNHGTLINDGTVHDDLDNTGTFANNQTYNADVATNTGTIDNNEPGVWTGNIETNVGTINNNAGSTWKGDVVANAGVIQNSGTWEGHVLSNVGYIRNYGTWTGRVDMNTYKDIHNRGADAVWNGDVTNNTQIVNADGARWNGKVQGNNNAIFNDVNSFWTGAVVANGGGENGLAQINNLGTWAGAVDANEGMIFNIDGMWTGDVLSNADLIVNNLNDVTNNALGVNQTVWEGDVVTNTGAIFNEHAGIWMGDIQTNSGTIVNRAGATWTGNVLANAGTIDTSGTWTGNVTSGGRLTASGTITGAVDTSGGRLELTGNLTAGSVVFDQNSFFDVGVGAGGVSERMTVLGNAVLAGTVRVSAGQVQGDADFATPYTILRADSIITGSAFDSVITDLAFLTPDVSVDGTEVILKLARNNIGFASTGVTANQQSVAAAVTSLGTGNSIYDAFLWLTAAQAQDALDQLSGESKAAAGKAAIAGANVIRKLVASRVDQAFEALGDTGDTVSNYAGNGLPLAPAADESRFWGQVYGTRGLIDAGEGTAALDSYNGGIAGGLDGMAGDWRLGVLMHLGTTGTNVDALTSSTISTDYGLGVYGGTQWGATRLSLGGIVTLHDNIGEREVGLPGFADTLSSDYLSGTAQAFAELSHEFDFGAFSITPFGNVAQLLHASEAYTETGGAAALTTSGNRVDATFATLGIGLDRQFVVDGDKLLSVGGSLGWRQAIADPNTITNAFSTGTNFSVIGAPIAGDAMVIEARMALDVSATTYLDLVYDGQIGGGTQTHAMKASYSNGF